MKKSIEALIFIGFFASVGALHAQVWLEPQEGMVTICKTDEDCPKDQYCPRKGDVKTCKPRLKFPFKR